MTSWFNGVLENVLRSYSSHRTSCGYSLTKPLKIVSALKLLWLLLVALSTQEYFVLVKRIVHDVS